MAVPPCLGVLATATCVAWLATLVQGRDVYCFSEYGLRGGGTSTYDLAFVDSPEACCDRCADQYPKCRMWNHDSRTGACGLATEFVIGAFDDNFTVGEWRPRPPAPRPAVPAPAQAPSSDPREEASPGPFPVFPVSPAVGLYLDDYDLEEGGTAASSAAGAQSSDTSGASAAAATDALAVPYPDVTGAPCGFTNGTTFPGKFTFPEGNETATVNDCCQLCEREPRCYSWTWQRDKELCFMKNGVVPAVPSPNFVSGTTV
eukprot:evm.model.scf_2757.1 EVM.evm.TU.scf_2757.1   scf_2757:11545-12321(+)